MESNKIESVVAAARQTSAQLYGELLNDMASQSAGMLQSDLGQIVDNMAEVSSTDAVDQTLEFFSDDILKSTIVAHSSEETDGLGKPLIDVLV